MATATDYTYETESGDEELSSESEDEFDVFQLPKVYDSKDVDVRSHIHFSIISITLFYLLLPSLLICVA
jgi:hypothetical protein